MENRIFGSLVLLLIILLILTSCQMKMEEYPNTIEMYVYGNEDLPADSIKKIETIAELYHRYLFDIEQGIPAVEDTALKKIAPREDVEAWKRIYVNNRTDSKLEYFQLLDICAISGNNVNCLCLCRSNYSDYKTPRGEYYFITRIDLEKAAAGWIVDSSEILGVGNIENTIIFRDDITNKIKMARR